MGERMVWSAGVLVIHWLNLTVMQELLCYLDGYNAVTS